MSTMDKSVYNMKAEKIQKQVKQGDYATAVKICDTIDWSQIRSARMLSLVSSVYEHVGRYDTAIDILLMAYEEASVGRRFLYKLTELALASGNIKEAEEYYKNYLEEAADDNSRFVLRYKIAIAKNESIDKKITILEAYKRQEFDEEWAYELATLYEQTGMVEKCLKLCDEIILWFGVGTFVEKAKELKEKYTGGDGVPKVAIAGRTESGQQVSALDMSLISREAADEEDEEDEAEAEHERAFGSTKRVSEKSEFSRTRKFEKIPANTAEMKIFMTVPANEEKQEEPAEAAAPGPEKEEIPGVPEQMEIDFGALEKEETADPVEKKYDHVIFVGADAPSIAMEQSIEAIKEVHAEEGSEMMQIAKISAVKLNDKGIINSLVALSFKDLIILGASALDDTILSELKKATEEIDSRKIFVLADSKQRIGLVKSRYKDLPAPKEESAAEPVNEPEEIEPAIMSALASAVEEIEQDEKALEPEEIAMPVDEPEEIEPEEIIESEDEPEEEIEEEPESEEIEEEPEEEEPEEEPEPEAEEIEPEPEDIKEEPEEEEPEEEPEPEAEEIEPEPEKIEKEPEDPEPAEKAASDRKDTMDARQFIDYMKSYMRTIDCVFAEGTEEELIPYIEELREDGEKLGRILAEEMVEEAANEAESHSFGNMFRSRYDESGNLVLRAKHFI